MSGRTQWGEKYHREQKNITPSWFCLGSKKISLPHVLLGEQLAPSIFRFCCLIQLPHREGRQKRLKCFSCGSLFNRDSPPCAQFDPADREQVMTCNEGEACMLYTWNKSRTEIGDGIIAHFLFNQLLTFS